MPVLLQKYKVVHRAKWHCPEVVAKVSVVGSQGNVPTKALVDKAPGLGNLSVKESDVSSTPAVGTNSRASEVVKLERVSGVFESSSS